MFRKLLYGVALIFLALLVVIAAMAWWNWDTVQRVFLGGVKIYESVPPTLPSGLQRPAVLVFSKTNGFRHEDAIPAGNQLFTKLAADKGWGLFQTENGATFSPDLLAKFDAIVFNNTSGDVLTPDQRAAFKGFIEQGGGYIGIHAAGDRSHGAWRWYVTDVIGTTFIGHPLDPQFQTATLHVENRNHPATAHLADTWERTDEWYSFDKSPRQDGVNVLATLDESSYSPGHFFGTKLAMGKDHPVIWTRCIGQGRLLYSALGHTAASFSEPKHVQFLDGALEWAMRLKGEDCAGKKNFAKVQ